MVYDREMGVMRLLLTAPLPRWVLLACKLVAGTALSVITCYVFLAVCIPFDVTFEPMGWLYVLPALIVSGLMLGALWLFISVYIKQVENFAGAMRALAELRAPVDAFFDKVTVNADDPKLRAARLGLLGELGTVMNKVADISKLSS